ncbi:hypothetical protein M3F30_07905 [Corynebacterium sanguinis]|uniref:hypothetical protein n=2 Tax=Corynebacterium sanguinis TaxID=2594913 RepID=UPI00223B8024|nr:hypothetical protein [Corynebacterium sanguinis]MCT2288498.1 hypothetical protein [Corynebacterium sanguinis]
MHRHLVVPFVVVPFFFICPVHTGHRGLFGVTGKANQHPATTLKRRSGGLNEKRARIRTKSLFKPDLYSLICGNRKNQTHILLLNPEKCSLIQPAMSSRGSSTEHGWIHFFTTLKAT